jgi:hypothetical protein
LKILGAFKMDISHLWPLHCDLWIFMTIVDRYNNQILNFMLMHSVVWWKVMKTYQCSETCLNNLLWLALGFRINRCLVYISRDKTEQGPSSRKSLLILPIQGQTKISISIVVASWVSQNNNFSSPTKTLLTLLIKYSKYKWPAPLNVFFCVFF